MPKPDVPQPDERARAAEALALRRAGMRYDEIADRLGYGDPSGPRKAVSRLLDRTEAAGVAELRAVEGERLDALLAAHWDAAIAGDIDATKAVLAVIDRRAKLFGLNAPTALAVGGVVLTDREFAEQAVELIAELRPDAARELAATAGIIHGHELRALPEGESTREPVSSASGAHSGATEPEPWADVDLGPVPDPEPAVEPVADPVLTPNPEPIVAEAAPATEAERGPVAVGQTTSAQRRYRMPAGEVYAPPVDGFRRRLGGGRPVTDIHSAP